jgi:uncharacterized membrane protein HdeD (DUF308 family)
VRHPRFRGAVAEQRRSRRELRISRIGSAHSPIRRELEEATLHTVNRTTEVVMSTILQQAEHMAEDRLKRMRWALGLSGALSVLFGVVILIWPSISLYALVLLFGAYALVRGSFGLAAAITGPIKQGRDWLAVSSVASIVVGVVVFFFTDMSALALLYVIGAYAVVIGSITVGAAFRLPLDSGDRILLALTGFVSIVFGVVMFAKPDDGALVLLGLIAAYALIVGFAELAVAIGGRRLLVGRPTEYLRPSGPQTSN